MVLVILNYTYMYQGRNTGQLAVIGSFNNLECQSNCQESLDFQFVANSSVIALASCTVPLTGGHYMLRIRLNSTLLSCTYTCTRMPVRITSAFIF